MFVAGLEFRIIGLVALDSVTRRGGGGLGSWVIGLRFSVWGCRVSGFLWFGVDGYLCWVHGFGVISNGLGVWGSLLSCDSWLVSLSR